MSKAYADMKLDKGGGTMSGDINMSLYALTNVPAAIDDMQGPDYEGCLRAGLFSKVLEDRMEDNS